MSRGSAPAEPLRAEHELILRCARTRLRPEDAERIRALAGGALDWLLLVETAVRQGVSPLVYWHLKALCADTVPPAFLEFLQISFENTTRQNLSLTAHLFRILEIFEAKGILAIPYKGPVLASLAYQSLAQREFSDLDLLVRHRDIGKAQEELLAEGFQPDEELVAGQRRHPGRVPGQYLFRRKAGMSLVELHTERTLRYFPTPLDFDRLQERLVRASVVGRSVLTFSPEDLLAVLCVHGSKHIWSRVQWICDLAELVQVPGLVDWGLALERASQMRAERMLLFGLYLAQRLLDAPLPVEMSSRVQVDPAFPRLAELVRRQLFLGEAGLPGLYERSWFRVQSQKHFLDGVQYCLRLAVRPSEEDWAHYPLPTALWPLYHVLRPLRLLGKYRTGAIRRAEPDLAPFVPTPPEAVERMLALGEVGPGDVLYDLGCGDGRVVVAAAKRFGIRCIGVDLDPRRIAEAKACARAEGVEHLAKFVHQDAKAVDLSEASVVTLYLSLLGNMKLGERLRDLRPGARVVSRDFGMPGWPPEKKEQFELADRRRTTLYLWRIPAPSISASDQPAARLGASWAAVAGQ